MDGYTINSVSFAVDLDAAPMLQFGPAAALRPVSEAIERNMRAMMRARQT